ncbi:MAG TPA: helicase-related protein [Bauldia sp.]
MTASGKSEGAPANGRNVVAVLGPTNTGKTHLAIERMLGHASGVIGLPLRLLAREVYNRVATRVGSDNVALITGEEKIVPPNPRFRVCTVEAMPEKTDAAFLAIDEIQLAGDLERGHVFTDRMLNLRGREETLLLGAMTMRGMVEKLIPGVNVVTRPRMSLLTYSGAKKITRLPQRSAVVAFSADEVYAIAELIRRQRGGAAVVLGSLSPRTRNAQVELFQSGEVDFLVATDAIGMGLNLDVDHVAFASERKFDGYQYRRLSAAELGQIAGRAGRHMRDGTFGVTGRAEPLEDGLVEALERHTFDPVKVVQWRNRDLDFASLADLKASLDHTPDRPGLTRAPPSVDVDTLDRVARDDAVAGMAVGRERVALLWDICQIPDYRKIAPANHAELAATLFMFVARDGAVSDDWFASQVAFADHVDGDIDTLANRIAHIRTWTFAANRPQWLRDPVHWQERTRAIEDRLSDALHERLTARFVDRRTSVLMRRLKENAMLEAEITTTGDVLVEGQHVGSLDGFRFAPDPSADGPEAKALRAAAQKALAGEIAGRAEKVAGASNGDFVLAADGTLRWQGAAIARLTEGDDALKPRLLLLADEALPAPAREQVQARIDLWLVNHAETLLKPLLDLRAAEMLAAPARGIAFRLSENFGIIERSDIAEEVKALDQDARAGLRMLGVRFGAYHIYVPALLKPAPSALLATLWALKNGGLDVAGLADLSRLAASGRTSVAVDPAVARPLYRIVGYKIAGNRAVRVDILERLADLIRPLIAWRPTAEQAEPPAGAIHGYGFTATVAMTSLLGCSGEDFAGVLRSLGYRLERKPAPTPATSATAAPAPGEAVPTEGRAATADLPDVETIAAEVLPPADIPIAADAEPVLTVPVAPVEPQAPAEPVFIEIWRPAGRRDREHAPRPRRHQRAPVQTPARAAGSSDGAVAPAEAAAPPADAAADARPVEQRGDRQPRPNGGGDHRKRGNGASAEGDGPRRDRGPRPQRDGKNGGHRDGGRDANDRPRREPRGEPMNFSTEPPKAERRKVADPNSPFAALAALKAQLEAKERGG